MDKELVYHIISKYLNKEASQKDIDLIQEWLNQSTENQKEFIQLKKVWLLSDNEIEKKIEDSKSNIWNNIVNHFSETSIPKRTNKTLFYSAISVAATILIMICVNFITNNLNKEEQYTCMYMPKGEKGQIFLPDGTKVWLNSGSKIATTNDFNTENRKVYLEGEAYFDVTKSTKNKFTVDINGIDVVVYGTAFKVTAYPETPNIKVALQRGLVSVFNNTTNEILATLKPNEEIIIERNTYVSKKQRFESDCYISWTFDELIFEYSSIEEVFSKMENWYGVNIQIRSPRPDLKYRFKIKTESLTEILQLINKMTPIEYKINGKEVTITYK